MYPFLRVGVDLALHGRKPLDFFDTHCTTHRIWPWDIDLWGELNNGRILTIFDVSRLTLAVRTGLAQVLRREGWGLTMAGSSVRYRRRVRMWQKVTVQVRALGWDARFLYIEQSMWRGTECTGHMLARVAVTDRAGLVVPTRLLPMLGLPEVGPDLPDWVAAWIAAEASRPWPPGAPPPG